MFKTVKGKIIFISMCMLLILCVVTASFIFQFYISDKNLKIESYDLKVNSLTLQINKYINVIETNARDLSLLGKLFYSLKDFSSGTLSSNVIKSSQNNKYIIGGGVFFEPYVINPKKKTFYSSSYKVSSEDKVESYIDTIDYDYTNEAWYKEIIQGLGDTTSTVWTKPYYDYTSTQNLITTIAVGIYDNSNKLIGIATVDWKLDDIYNGLLKYIPTKDSLVLLANTEKDFIFFTYGGKKDNNLDFKLLGKPLEDLSWYNKDVENLKEIKIEGVKYISFVRNLNNKMVLIVNVPKKTILGDTYSLFFNVLFLLLITICIVVGLTYKILLKYVYNPLAYIKDTAKKIGDGDLTLKIENKELGEFVDLATAFNNMTQNIQEQVANITKITLEKENFYKELSIAKTIQTSSLPNVFPAYPNRKEFDIYAMMNTAKEVGGDFYDFFFIDSHHIVYLIADVSGKGVPAALFMMRVKTLIRNYAKNMLEPKSLIEKINQKIFETNTQDFFVTMFLAITDLRNGKTKFINAGHNPPLIKRGDGVFEYLDVKPNLILGIKNHISYIIDETVLAPEDMIILYTDGVTEAINSNKEFYGEERLKTYINDIYAKDYDLQSFSQSILDDVKQFAGVEEQADDITMLFFKYKGQTEKLEVCNNKNGNQISIPAKVENLAVVVDWLANQCKEENVKDEIFDKLNLVTEEIFVNIASYAYSDKEGDVIISFKVTEDKEVELTFIDGGIQYNPLDKMNPQVEDLDIQNMQVGGFGIYLVKNIVDYINYEYNNQYNVLTIRIKS